MDATPSGQASSRSGVSIFDVDSNDPLDQVFVEVMERLRFLFFRRMAAHDLTPPLMATLKHLAEGSVPMREIASRLMCDASNMTGIADRLEERGLLARRSDPDDRRVKLLVLTDNGRAVLADLGASLLPELPGLGRLDDDQRAQLAALLSIVASNDPDLRGE